MTTEPLNPVLPVGSRYAGRRASDVPPEYLLSLAKTEWFPHARKWREVHEYVEINLQVLKVEATQRAKRRLGMTSRRYAR